MQSPHNPGDSYRLIVTRRKASEILLSQEGSGWTLPGVGIRPRQRVAEQLVSELYGDSKPTAYLFQTLRISAEMAVGQGMPLWSLFGITTKRLPEPAGCRRPQPPTVVMRERPRLSGNLSRNLILT